jgi:hypothetical protein
MANVVHEEIKAIEAILVSKETREIKEIKVNEENKVHKEFLVNEGSLESVENKDRVVLTEPMDVTAVMEQKERQEKAVLKAFLAEMEKTDKMAKTEQ